MNPGRARRARAPLAEAIEPRVLLSTYVVANTDDSGPGSLRQAILDANADPAWDTIAFNIPGDGVHTIQPLTALPDITDATTIDGYTQPGSKMNTGNSPGDDAVINIVIDGRLTSTPLQIHFNAPMRPFRVQGICLNHADGIRVQSTFAPVQIWGNFLGTDPTGMSAAGSMQTDVDLEGVTNAQIGGDLPWMRNLIDNGSQFGVLINSGQSDQVFTNWVGVGADGRTPIGNRVGIAVENGAGDHVQRNVISGNRVFTAGDPLGGTGLSVSGHHSGLFIQNLVGTDPTGLMAVSNQGAGAVFDGNSLGSQIVQNTFSGNAGDGLVLTPATGSAVGSVNLIITQNQVGTDASGTKPLGNSGSGIRVSAAGFFITANTISANGGNGVDVVASAPAFGTSLLRNQIGTDPGATLDLGNGGDGVRIESGVSQVSVYGDTIAFNGGNGVTVGLSAADTQTLGNTITHSAIYLNHRLGIDLANDGPTPNHVTGTGPNSFQPYPEFFARTDAGGTHVTATLIGINTALGAPSVDFYASPPPAAGQTAQGQLFLGSYTFNAFVGGSLRLQDAPLQQPVPKGWVLTATAAGRGTSEFSPPQLPHLSGDLNGDGTVDFTDLLALAGHYGQMGTLADGDANDDGTVNFIDLLILAQNYGQRASPAAAATAAAPPANDAGSEFILVNRRQRRAFPRSG